VPASTINDYARHINPDLIIMGAKGLRATLGILLGGVAQQVVEYSCCPVLVVRAPYSGISRVLIVTDGSKYSQCALEYIGETRKSTRDSGAACRSRFPLPTDADVRVMHVLPPLITADLIARSWTVGPDLLYPLPTDNIDESGLKEEEEGAGQELLDKAVKTLRTAGINASSVMVRGDAATEIIEYIKAHEIDFVVCGSRGLSQVTSWLLGSVSRKLVHYSGCSVLIVKRGSPKPTVV
jgi:nucleotide-binding universal stress UspA family protein